MRTRLAAFLTGILLALALFCAAETGEQTEGGFVYRTDGGVSVLLRYTGRAETVDLPASLGGMPLQEIGAFAFLNASARAIRLPDSVKSIGDSAFSGCVSLRRLTLPRGLAGMGENPFKDCVSLRLQSDSPRFVVREGFLIDDAEKTLVCALNAPSLFEESIPEGIVSIGPAAFSGAENMRLIRLPESLNAISDRAFMGCAALERAEGGKHLKSIGRLAFSRCERLAEAPLPRSLETIGDSAFFECRSLTQAAIPEGVKRLPHAAFSHCAYLAAAQLPKGLTQIDPSAFHGCPRLTLLVDPGSAGERFAERQGLCYSARADRGPAALEKEIRIAGNFLRMAEEERYETGDAGKGLCLTYMEPSARTLPRQIGGRPVTRIGKNLLAYTRGRQVLSLPPSVTEVGPGAFLGMAGLRAAVLPEGLRSLAGNAFLGCSLLETVILPESLAEIDENAFRGLPESALLIVPKGSCAQERALYLGKRFAYADGTEPDADTLAQARQNALTRAEEAEQKRLLALEKSPKPQHPARHAYGKPEEPLYTLNEYAYRLYKTGQAELAAYTGSAQALTLPASLSGHPLFSIAEGAFLSNRTVESLTLPEGLSLLREGSLSGMEALTRLSLPASLQSVEGNPVTGCPLLKTLDVSAENPRFLAYGNLLYDKAEHCVLAFMPGCCSAGLPDLTHVIGKKAFAGAQLLTRLELPKQIKTIEDAAFQGCTALRSITLPGSIESLGSRVFSGCTGLASAKMAPGLLSLGPLMFQGCVQLRDVCLPYTLESMNTGVFEGCESLETLDLPFALYDFSDNPFVGCTRLSSLTIHEDHPVLAFRKGLLLDVQDGRVIACVNGKTKTTIPEGVRTVGDRAFFGSPVSSVAFPESLTDIGASAFEGAGLFSVTLPPSLVSIGDRAFAGCGRLTSASMADSVIAMGREAFFACPRLHTVLLSGSLLQIGDDVFAGCPIARLIVRAGSFAQAWAKEKNIPALPQ